MTESYDKAKGWLTEMGLKFMEKPEENKFFLLHKIGEFHYFVKIICTDPKWIYSYIMVYDGVDLPAEKQRDVFRALLIQNKLKEDLTYSLDEENNIYSENDSPIDSNLGAFKSEYEAALNGIKIFNDEIAPKLGLTMRDTIYGKTAEEVNKE